MEGIFENLPHLFKKGVFGDLGENGNIFLRILHMNVDLVRVRLILRRRGFHNGVENGLLTRKMIVERRRFDTDRPGNFAYADGIIALRREQFQSLIQNFLLGILLFHTRASLTNIR